MRFPTIEPSIRSRWIGAVFLLAVAGAGANEKPERLIRGVASPPGTIEIGLGPTRAAQLRPTDGGWEISIYQNTDSRSRARLIRRIAFPAVKSSARYLHFLHQWTASPDGRWLLGSTIFASSEQRWVLLDTQTGKNIVKQRPALNSNARANQIWTSNSTFIEVRTDQSSGIQVGEYQTTDLKRIGAWSIPSETDWFYVVGLHTRMLHLTTRVLDQHRMLLKSITLPESDGVKSVEVSTQAVTSNWVEMKDRMVVDVHSSPDGRWIAWATIETKPGTDEYVVLESKPAGKKPRSGAIGRIEVTDITGRSPRTLLRSWRPLVYSKPNFPIGDVRWLPSADRVSFWLADGYYTLPFNPLSR